MDSIKNNVTNVIKNTNPQDIWKIIISYSKVIMIILFSAYVAGMLAIAATMPDIFMTKPFVVIILILVPIILISLLYFSSGEMSLDYKVIATMIVMGVCAFIGYILYYFLTMPSKTGGTTTISYISIFIAAAIIIIGLSIYYTVFINTLKKQKGWTGFMINLLFYLPCLISDYFKYLFNEAVNTPSTIFILFIIEICLLLLYIYLPPILYGIYVPTGVTLLGDPLFLASEVVIGNSERFLLNAPIDTDSRGDINSTTPTDIYNTNFSLYMWIYVNNTIVNMDKKESMIFKYAGKNDFYGKPSVSYLGDDNWRFMFSNIHGYESKTPPVDLHKVQLPEYIVKMPSQKWHHIVFTYTGSYVDLYINGSLARSMDISKRLPTKHAGDLVTIGTKKEYAVPGAICNVNYYANPLSSIQVAGIYNLLFLYNPPVNNLH